MQSGSKIFSSAEAFVKTNSVHSLIIERGQFGRAGMGLGLEFLSRKTIQQCHPGQEVSHELRVGGGAVVDAQGDGAGYPQDLMDHSLEEQEKKGRENLNLSLTIL